MTHKQAPPTGDDSAEERIARLERENLKLRKINQVLIERVERGMDSQGNAYSLFQTAVSLEAKVRERTLALMNALENLETAKAAAETARGFLMEAIESIDEGFLLCDRNDRLVLTNERYRRLFPALAQQLAPGDTFETLIRRLANSGILEDAAEDPEGWALRRLASHLAPGEPIVLKMRNGNWLQVSERRTSDGGSVSLYTDITMVKLGEERRRERELAEKSVLLQSTLDNLAQGVCVFDRFGRLVNWNHRFAELLAIPPILLKPGILQQDLPIPESCSEGTAVAEYVTPSGRILEVRRTPMPGCNFVTTYTDITQERLSASQLREAKEGLEVRVEERTQELRQANEELTLAKGAAELANMSKTRFLAAVSHDLLQPLSAARVFVSVLAERHLPRESRNLARNALSAMDSLDEILASLLDISKLETVAHTVQIGDFTLSELFSHLAEEYSLTALRKDIRLRVVPSHLPVRSDPRLLGRIVRNYLSNAMRYTEAGGRVLVGCRRHGDKLLVGVWDSGIGIPPDKLDEIFEEFHRLPGGQRQDERGMGLGLSIVRGIAKVLDHPLVVRSRLGKGSNFAVLVPLAPTDSPLAPHPPAQDRLPTAISRLDGARVALIDNDPAVLSSMETLLTHWRCKPIAVASNRADLLASLQSGTEAPDAIVADYQLDDGDTGLDAIREVRERYRLDIPAVIITANYTENIGKQAQENGCHLLNKPIRQGKLRSLLVHMLRNRTA